MTAPSPVSTGVFVLIVLGVAAMFLVAWRSAAAGPSRLAVPIVVVAGWLVIPAALALSGRLDRYDRLPPPALAMVGLLTVATLALGLSSVGARLASAQPLTALVGFQFFRVPLEWVLHRLYTEGVIPVQMTYAGRNFDIVSGMTAAVVAMMIVAGRGGRWLVLTWNVLGLALLANIVTIAALSTPVPFRRFMNEPPNLLLGMFPFVWLPTFLVQAALFGHLLVFRALGRRST